MRSFKSAFTKDFLRKYQDGVMKYQYRGIECLRSPIDMAIQGRAIWDNAPGTIIEIGSHHGASALWMADLVGNYGRSTPIYSIDVKVPALTDPRINFVTGDVMDLGAAFAAHGIFDAPRPWFVLEDSAHTYPCCLAALEFLGEHMQAGELLCMEDGLLDELGVSANYGGGPNRAIAEYMQTHPGVFEVDEALCDTFGVNATYAPNGYLRKL
ncbi:CmcI family methyltransferase [Roseovarius sp. ZX-A-9]|uniref:CmcI family methyltransferase n=1 Tax=Roseovarius sp. ZX-A-9 TaxID=3014783 RepID=UPI0023312334|nr:CmcI family methyltransferase [Roseovarius sp. ZX-A-9]